MKKTILSLASLAFVCAMTLTSCEQIMSTIDNPVSSYVQFKDSVVTLLPGETYDKNAATTISTEKVTYTTSNDKVATVDANGKVTAVAFGEAVITANVKSNDYYQAGSSTYKVKVVSILQKALKEGATVEILLKDGDTKIEPKFVVDEKGEYKLQNPVVGVFYGMDYKTDDKVLNYAQSIGLNRIITVDFDVTNNTYLAYAANSQVTVEFAGIKIDGKDVTKMLTKKEAAVEAIFITTPTWPFEMSIGDDDVTLATLINPEKATDKKVTWTSSNPAVATIDKTGKVHAVACGTTIITAKTSNGKVATEELTVMYNLAKLTDAYEAKNGDILTGTTSFAISIAKGATVTLSGATINNSVTCLGDATIMLREETVNQITSGNTALIVGPAATTLTIDGKGQLDAKGGGDKSGIGSKNHDESGNIVINGGTINASSSYGAAIGAADLGGKIGDITINGGKVTATALSSYGAAIGSGDSYGGGSTCGNITITGGEVIATGGNGGAGIGSGGLEQDENSTCGNITITGGKVTATGGNGAAGIGTGYKNGKSTDTKCGNITISGGTVVAIRGGGASWDVGPGVGGTVGTVNAVDVKNKDGNKASVYPGAASAPRRASANAIQLPAPRR